MRILYIIVTLTLLIGACKQKSTAKSEAPAQEKTSFLGKQLPESILADLLIKSTNIDVVFFSLPISINQDEKLSVNRTVEFINRQPVPTSQQCPAIGRMSIIDHGEVLRDLNVHFGKSCAYFSIYEDNKPVYYSLMSQDGINFFNNLFKQTGVSAQ